MSPLTDTSAPGPAPRPRLISQSDFAELATLAYMRDPSQALASQLAKAEGVTERTAQRWLNPQGPPAPQDVIRRALVLADKRSAELADALDRIAAALK